MVGFTVEDFNRIQEGKEIFDSWEVYEEEIGVGNSEEYIECEKIAFQSITWEECLEKIQKRFPEPTKEDLPQKEPKIFVDVPVPYNNQFVALKSITVVVYIQSNLLLQKLKSLENKPYNQGLLTKFTISQLQEEKILVGTHNSFSLVEPITSSDPFGLYTFDPFFGNLKIVVQMNEKATIPLPNRFTLHPDASVSILYNTGKKLNGSLQSASNSVEGFVHYVLSNSNKPMDLLQEWTKSLTKASVYSINDLADWQKQHWERTDLPVDAQRIMFRDIHTYVDLVREKKNNHKNNSKSNNNNNNNNKNIVQADSYLEKIKEAKEYAMVHNIERYLQHLVGDGNRDRGFLDRTAVKKGFEAMREMTDIPVGIILFELERAMEELCLPNDRNHLKSPFLGILLYGPPGTGKTQLCIQLSDLCGLTPVNYPIAATDANRPHVGETEEALRAIFGRAKLMPHLLHCLAIDEIDGITQKRTDKVSEHAISTMSELLALVGGIKAIPNLLLMGSTNRPHMMDDAMLRRLPRKFFVGRPSSDLRKRAFIMLVNNYHISFEQGSEELFLMITTNYHGAALQSICSQIRYITRCKQEEQNLSPISKKELVEICSRVSTSYQIFIGPFIVANLLQDVPKFVNIKRELRDRKISIDKCTGRILVDITNESIQIELNDNTVENILFETSKYPFASKLVPTYVKFALDEDIEMVQYIDSEVLNSHAAFDEQTIQETLQEFIMEFQGYQKSLLILDMDSLAGISCSHSHSSMGLSKSYSYSKPTLASWVFTTSKCAMQMGPGNIAHWLIVVSTSDFTLQSFKEMARFPQADFEIQKEKISKEESTVPVKCKQCDKYYLRSDNKPLDCVYHPRKVDPFAPNFDPKKFRFSCCNEQFPASSSTPSGCRSGPHIFE